MKVAAPYVLVVGSTNIDVSVSAAALPQSGETVIGYRSLTTVGGKGANQAVAAAACGAMTHFVGRVGPDAFGCMILDDLADRQVQTKELRVVEEATTGLATICVEDSGKNCIVVVPGANARLQPSDLQELAPLIRDAEMVVLQCEIPLETVYRAIELATAAATRVILNPSPCLGLDFSRIAEGVTYLVPNETEASQIARMPVDSIEQARICAARLQGHGTEFVIITLGANGCVVADENQAQHYAGHRVAAIDTTGAGDAFIGCLAASLAAGRSRNESIQRALLYSALSTTQRGAQVSYPRGEDFECAWRAAR